MVLVTAVALQKGTLLCPKSEKPQVSVSSGDHPDQGPGSAGDMLNQCTPSVMTFLRTVGE